MEYEYDSQIISPRNASCQQCNGNESVHFATTLPTVNCQLSTVNCQLDSHLLRQRKGR